MASLRLKLLNRFKGTALGTWMRRKRWNASITNADDIANFVQEHWGELSVSEQKEIASDILDMAKRYRFTASEYVCYHFRDKPEEERKTFISDLNRIDFCERLNKAKNLEIFNDKSRTYRAFGKYYLRECAGVFRASDIPDACAHLPSDTARSYSSR